MLLDNKVCRPALAWPGFKRRPGKWVLSCFVEEAMGTMITITSNTSTGLPSGFSVSGLQLAY